MQTIRFHEEEYERAARALSSVSNALDDCASKLPSALALGLPGVEERLFRCRVSLRSVSNRADRLSSKTKTAARILNACEADQKAGVSTIGEKAKLDLSLLYKIIGKFGDAGSLLGPLAALYGKQDVESAVKLVGSGGKAVAKWFERRATSEGGGAGNLFGLKPYLKKASTAPVWKSALRENFATGLKEEMNLGKLSKRIGLGVSAVTSGISNYQEWKSGDITADRAVVETVVETGVGFVVSGVVTAGVGAVAATAAAALGAPIIGSAVVVGAASVAVVWAVDMGVKAITGTDRGLTESVGHVAGEVYDFAKTTVNKAADATGAVISAARDTVAAWGKSMKRGLRGGLLAW